MHFVDLLLHPFLEFFLQLSTLTSSSTAKIIFDSFISEAGLSKTYPPLAPLELFTSFNQSRFQSFENLDNNSRSEDVKIFIKTPHLSIFQDVKISRFQG